jgi:hypothetical protein
VGILKLRLENQVIAGKAAGKGDSGAVTGGGSSTQQGSTAKPAGTSLSPAPGGFEL